MARLLLLRFTKWIYYLNALQLQIKQTSLAIVWMRSHSLRHFSACHSAVNGWGEWLRAERLLSWSFEAEMKISIAQTNICLERTSHIFISLGIWTIWAVLFIDFLKDNKNLSKCWDLVFSVEYIRCSFNNILPLLWMKTKTRMLPKKKKKKKHIKAVPLVNYI